MKRIENGYEVRQAIKAVGGRFSGGTWTLTDEQYAALLTRVEESERRSNKRDTQLARDWSRVVVTDVAEPIKARVAQHHADCDARIPGNPCTCAYEERI